MKTHNFSEYGEMKGDFNFVCDISLHNYTEKKLINELLKLSEKDYMFAIPDDESHIPDACLLIKDGKLEKVYVSSDDDTDETTIIFLNLPTINNIEPKNY